MRTPTSDEFATVVVHALQSGTLDAAAPVLAAMAAHYPDDARRMAAAIQAGLAFGSLASSDPIFRLRAAMARRTEGTSD